MKLLFRKIKLPLLLRFRRRQGGVLMLCAVMWGACSGSGNNGTDPEPEPGAIEVPAGALTLAVQPENLQQIQGWGIYPGHNYGYMPFANSITQVPAARTALLEDLGVNIFRGELVPQAGENYTATGKTLSQPYLDDLAAHVNDAVERGVDKYMISIWSPPFHMKEVYDASTTPGVHNYRPRLKTTHYDLFVEYVKDALLYLKNKGCPLPVTLSLQNEPEAGVVNTPDDIEAAAAFIDGAGLISLLGKMRTALNAAGLSAVKLGAPESVGYEGAWIFRWPPLPDSYFSIIDIHVVHSYASISYDDNTPANVEDPLTEFHRVKGQIGKESWQTEFSVAGAEGMGGNTALRRLMTAMRIFSSDMVHAGHTVWMWWCGWFPGWSIDNPDQQVLIDGDGKTSVRKSAMFDAFATIFNNVPPGSHVRKVVTNDPSLKTNFRIMNDLAAFQTENGTFILLVNGDDAPKTYYVSGLTGATGTRKTIAGDNATTTDSADFTVTGGMAKVSVPRNSVNFIYTQNN